MNVGSRGCAGTHDDDVMQLMMSKHIEKDASRKRKLEEIEASKFIVVDLYINTFSG